MMLLNKKIKVLLGGPSKVSYQIVQPILSNRRRRSIEIGLVVVLLATLFIVPFLAVKIAPFSKTISSKGITIILASIALLFFWIVGLIAKNKINQVRNVGEQIIEDEGLYFSNFDRFVAFEDIMKVWYSANLLDDYMSKYPHPYTILVKMLNSKEEKFYFEVEIEPSYGNVRGATSNIPNFEKLLEYLKPRYGLHKNRKLKKVNYHNQIVV